MITLFKNRTLLSILIILPMGAYAYPVCHNLLWPAIINIGQTKDDAISLSDIFAFAAIIVSVITLIYTVWFNVTGNKRSVKETFWMREVLIPKFLDNFFAFIQDSPNEYRNYNHVSSRFYTGYALTKINSIRDSTKWLRVSSEELEIKIREHIEDFEDEMMNVSDYESYVDLVFNLSGEVIKDIQNAQLNT